jgi:phosphoserine phosphatase
MSGLGVSPIIPSMSTPLESWRDRPVRQRIIDFVSKVNGENGSEPVPVEERVAVFDNDGTLWCEKPMPIQADFILRRLAEMATKNAELRERQPWQAAYNKDFAWFGNVIDEHYAGDDSKVKILLGGLLASYDGMSVEEFEAASDSFLRNVSHPTLGFPYLAAAYQPMIELLDYLAANGFANYIVSGGGRDFMRPITQDVYGIPRERVIGSTAVLAYTGDERGGTITHKAEPDYIDDGPQKPIRIWSRIGRRPLLAAGNSNGDLPMLEFSWHEEKPFLPLLVLHDDADREFDYTNGAEAAFARADEAGWAVSSIKSDWSTVFAAA